MCVCAFVNFIVFIQNCKCHPKRELADNMPFPAMDGT